LGFRFLFEVYPFRQGVGVESLVVEFRERFRIGHEPCLHALRHEMHLLLLSSSEIPAIALLKMGAG